MYQYDHHRGMTTTFAAAISIVALILLHRDDWKCCATRATARLNGDDNHNVVDYGGPKGAVDNHCNLFLAPSSIPNAGYGVFTAKKIRRGDYILRADGPNIAVLVQDVPASNHPNSSLSLFHNVWWGKMGGMSDHMWYETPRRGAVDVYDYQITLGALPNYHPYLSNLNFRQPHVVYDDQTADVPSGGGTTKQKGPNAGAVSYYTGKDFVAHRNIPAGGEIFLDYGTSLRSLPWTDWIPSPPRLIIVMLMLFGVLPSITHLTAAHVTAASKKGNAGWILAGRTLNASPARRTTGGRPSWSTPH